MPHERYLITNGEKKFFPTIVKNTSSSRYERYLITNGEKKNFPTIVKNTSSSHTLITDQDIIDTR